MLAYTCRLQNSLVYLEIMENTYRPLNLLFYGLIAGILFNLLPFIFLQGDDIYSGNGFLSLFFLIAIGAFFFFILKKDFSTPYDNPLRTVLIFSLILGTCMGIGHIIHATLIDPEWSQNALIVAQENWMDRGYSQSAIAGQIELTDTFHNPYKWAVVMSIFFTVITAVIGSIVAFILYLKNKWLAIRSESSLDFQ